MTRFQALPTELFSTEQLNPRTADIDQLDTLSLLYKINDEDALVATLVRQSLPMLVPVVEAAVSALKHGGQLLYFGAGTSGRLAVLDASECPPTYGTSPDMVQAFIAGGDIALRQAVEGAEDDFTAGADNFKSAWQPGTRHAPVVVGISASGSAAYVLGALTAAHEGGCVTCGITSRSDSPLAQLADWPVVVDTGPEVVAGSTRMKAGTAQKLVLNGLSTSVMVGLGKTYGNWMVDVYPANAKLRQRAIRMVSVLGQIEPAQAEYLLGQTGWQVKPAIVMAQCGCDAFDAQQRLAQADGRLRACLSLGFTDLGKPNTE